MNRYIALIDKKTKACRFYIFDLVGYVFVLGRLIKNNNKLSLETANLFDSLVEDIGNNGSLHRFPIKLWDMNVWCQHFDLISAETVEELYQQVTWSAL